MPEHTHADIVHAYFDGLIYLSDADNDDAPYFSWHACECCKSQLGSMRYGHAFKVALTDPDPILAYVCDDCNNVLLGFDNV